MFATPSQAIARERHATRSRNEITPGDPGDRSSPASIDDHAQTRHVTISLSSVCAPLAQIGLMNFTESQVVNESTVIR